MSERLSLLPLVSFVAALSIGFPIACSSGKSENDPPKHLVQADGAAPVEDAPAVTSTGASISDFPPEALQKLPKVYVPLSPASLQSLDDALEQNGYGNVRSSDFKPQFETVDTPFGPAITAFSSSDWIAPNSMFQPMSVRQWLEASRGVDSAAGVIINHGHPGQILALTNAEVAEVLTWLPQQEPLSMEIYVSQ